MNKALIHIHKRAEPNIDWLGQGWAIRDIQNYSNDFDRIEEIKAYYAQRHADFSPKERRNLIEEYRQLLANKSHANSIVLAAYAPGAPVAMPEEYKLAMQIIKENGME